MVTFCYASYLAQWPDEWALVRHGRAATMVATLRPSKVSPPGTVRVRSHAGLRSTVHSRLRLSWRRPTRSEPGLSWPACCSTQTGPPGVSALPGRGGPRTCRPSQVVAWASGERAVPRKGRPCPIDFFGHQISTFGHTRFSTWF